MQSIFLQAGMSMDAAVGFSSALGNTSYFHLDPAIHIEYRYYYNYARRQEKNKRTDMNSMNYFNAIVDCYLSKRRVASSDYDEEKLRPVYSAGIGWGFQRNFSKRFSLDYSLGPGVLITRVFRPDIVGEVYP